MIEKFNIDFIFNNSDFSDFVWSCASIFELNFVSPIKRELIIKVRS
jgi:hypothetical protein